jgi:hypothetical protein
VGEVPAGIIGKNGVVIRCAIIEVLKDIAATPQGRPRKVSNQFPVLGICRKVAIGPVSDADTQVVRIGGVDPGQLDLPVPWLGLKVADIHWWSGVRCGRSGEGVIP